MIDESSLPDITHEDYDHNGFKWSGAKDKIYSVINQEAITRDFHQRVRIFSLRLKSFYKQLQLTSSSGTNEEGVMVVVLSPLQISKKWMDFSKPLINEFPIDVLSAEIIDIMDYILNSYGSFFQIDLGENDSDWSYFVDLQKVCSPILSFW
jgi:hypothetical protein